MIDRDPFPARTASRGAFGALVRCACGHGIGAHTRAGCQGGNPIACACRVPDAGVLERAIAQAARELQAMPPPARRHAR